MICWSCILDTDLDTHTHTHVWTHCKCLIVFEYFVILIIYYYCCFCTFATTAKTYQPWLFSIVRNQRMHSCHITKTTKAWDSASSRCEASNWKIFQSRSWNPCEKTPVASVARSLSSKALRRKSPKSVTGTIRAIRFVRCTNASGEKRDGQSRESYRVIRSVWMSPLSSVPKCS